MLTVRNLYGNLIYVTQLLAVRSLQTDSGYVTKHHQN